MTWWELYSDFVQRLRTYRSDPATQPLLFLRIASQVIADFQRQTALLVRVGEFEWDNDLRGYALGHEVWAIRKCWLGNGSQWTPALPVAVEQAVEIINRDRSAGIAVLETPRHYGLHWRDQWAADRAPWIVWQEVVEQPNGTTGVLRVHPERAPEHERARLVYVQDFIPLTSTSPRWAWAYGGGVLEDQMQQQRLPQELTPYAPGIVAAVVWRYLQETGTLPPTEGVHPLLAEYQAAIAQARREARHVGRELVAPYNLSPYSS
jgi:hypothetical protein